MTFKEKIIFLIKGKTSENGNTPVEPKVKKVREKKITRLHLILACLVFIIVLIVFITIKVKISNKDKIYTEYEKELVNFAEIYYDINNINIKDGTVDRISIKKLKQANLLNTSSKLRDKCEGYVESTSEKNYNTSEYEITRKAYIKCGSKYKTVNYTQY